MNANEFVWSQKHRPHRIAECILPVDLKKTFQQFVDNGDIPNLILAGTAGVGKTTVAKAMLDELDRDYLVINGSMNGNIDTLRNEIMTFASTTSFKGPHRKYVILDEADYITPLTQASLRNFMEEYSKNCGFIMTCNFLNKIIEPLWSRCSVVQFKIGNADKAKLAAQFFKRTCTILDTENVTYDQKAVAGLIQLYFPDWRRCLNELQRYAATGNIDIGILRNHSAESIEELIGTLKDRKFNEMRKWIGEHSDIDSNMLYTALYDMLPTKLTTPASIADMVIVLADYQKNEAFVANVEINRVAAMATLMAELNGTWK